MKPAYFLGDAKKVLTGFPRSVHRDIGFQIENVQAGRDPDDWKPMPSIGREFTRSASAMPPENTGQSM
jgi:phage-related protein